MLLKVASQAISILSGDEDENIESNFLSEDKENNNSKFEKLSTQYLELVNDIQIGLRETFRFLTNTDIESSSYITNLPYICNTYGEEKDHEISVKILELVKTKINSILNSMGGSTIPLPISLSSSSIASASGSNFNMTTSLNNKFLNSRFSSNAELIASSLCSSNNNSNANIKVDDEFANDIVMSKKSKLKKEEELMDIDNTNETLNIKLEKNDNEPIKSNNDAMPINNDAMPISTINKNEDNNMKIEKSNNADTVMNLVKDNNESEIPDLDLDF
ncbi:hypothetical protein H8356DRAFT_1689262 [Neocallimastix lanati (nom. inval.)]|uniref:Mediator complex subunit 11 n=1 Tax=Neocallimastix californiae TaxID=1754190 RepID=A0A1Y2F0W2_9FUNG|nr:hypothetical protein H8356DRAFT_1689262 [Neocallimastix sp. JGI-2020a]ORY77483.1 hypothetical protein LY90DRAFT_92954 [Neocallimastix californiae]|eukprot:ORY77483.1 hypothetical protein LY90DRAFT_92954 [Neocallimastix californiae]